MCATEKFSAILYISTFFYSAKRTDVSQFKRIVDERIVEVLDEIYINNVWTKCIYKKTISKLKTNDHFFVRPHNIKCW